MANNESHIILNYEMRWKNFRCFKDTRWLEVRPITILIGANNSGKTSLITPLLMLKQTWLSSDPLTPLVTHGEIADLGRYDELIHDHDPSLDLFMGFRFHTHDPDDELEPLGEYPPGGFELTFSADDSPFGFNLKQYKVFDIFKRPFLTRRLYKSGKYSVHGKLFQEMPSSEREALSLSMPVNYIFTAPEAIASLQKIKGPDGILTEKYSDQFTMYLNIVSSLSSLLAGILRNLSYIGPLRDRPKRYYERGGEIHRSVGIRGQYAPDLLCHHYEEISERLNYWIRVFELGHSLKYHDLSSSLFEILMESKRKDFVTNIADTGFGASQLFPLIIQALVAKSDTLTIAEQPEIHLNPKLQTLLADLFVEMATIDHRVIIETHSEHLLLRLRVLVAEGKIRSDDVAVYFLSKTNRQSSIRRVTIKPNGSIDPEEWPTGFFADTLRESLALAAAQGSRADQVHFS